MATDRATCGHIIEPKWWHTQGAVEVKAFTREGERAVDTCSLCPDCLKYYRHKRLVLNTPHQREAWLKGKSKY